MVDLIQTFWNDGKVEILVGLILIDFFLGVLAALKTRTFRLSYVADFLRKDVVFKMGGYLVVYAGAYYAGEQDIVIPGLDLGVIAGAAYATILVAMAGSILSSLRELGLGASNERGPTTATADRSVWDMLSADEGI